MIINPTTFEPVHRLSVKQRRALMRIRNWLVTLNEFWTLHTVDTTWARSVRYGKDWVIQTINQVINDNCYTEDQKGILNAIRDEYKYNAK